MACAARFLTTKILNPPLVPLIANVVPAVDGSPGVNCAKGGFRIAPAPIPKLIPGSSLICFFPLRWWTTPALSVLQVTPPVTSTDSVDE